MIPQGQRSTIDTPRSEVNYRYPKVRGQPSIPQGQSSTIDTPRSEVNYRYPKVRSQLSIPQGQSSTVDTPRPELNRRYPKCRAQLSIPQGQNRESSFYRKCSRTILLIVVALICRLPEVKCAKFYYYVLL